MNLAIIPARGGSKRIPRKNIREFKGQPVIAYAINAIFESNLFDKLLVSTDDAEIASISRALGAEVPWMRPDYLSDDRASTDEVISHAVNKARDVYGEIEYACCVYPVNPLIDPEYLKMGYELIIKTNAPAVFPVIKYDFPIHQAFTLEHGSPSFLWPEEMEKPSQELLSCYHDAGMFYWFQVSDFLTAGAILSNNSKTIEINRLHCQDVNTEEDWILAEAKFLRLKELDAQN